MTIIKDLRAGEYVKPTTPQEWLVIERLWEDGVLIIRLPQGDYRLTDEAKKSLVETSADAA